MKLGILNSEQGIAVIDTLDDLGHLQTEEIKKVLPDNANIEQIAFFYMKDRDWIVINKRHPLFDVYSQLIPVYLELSAENRKEAYYAAPTDAIKAGFDILEDVIRKRMLIYGKVV